MKRSGAIALVAIGGAAGTTARFLLTEGPWDAVWATVAINLIGCALMGVAASALAPSGPWWPLVGPGFLGGFTTFSAFELHASESWSAVIVTVLFAPLVYCTMKVATDNTPARSGPSPKVAP